MLYAFYPLMPVFSRSHVDIRLDLRPRPPSVAKVGFALALLLGACERKPSGSAGSAPESNAAPLSKASGSAANQRAAASSGAAAASAAPKPGNPYDAFESTELLALPSSAYNATLAIDDEAIYVLTAQAAHRVVPGRPPQTFALDLSYGAAVTRSSFLFWSKESIWKANKQDGKARRIAKLPRHPQYFVSSGDDFAWLEKTEAGRFQVRSLDGSRPRTVYESPGEIEGATMLNDWVFFVERPSDAGWRIGAVRAGGGEPSFSPPRTGRTPAMLASWRDLYFYDGNSRSVVRLSPDLRQEEVLLRDFVCSPITVWERVYCAHVEGISVLPGPNLSGSTAAPQRASENLWGAVTAIAASSSRLAWLNDAGADKLSLRSMELPRL